MASAESARPAPRTRSRLDVFVGEDVVVAEVWWVGPGEVVFAAPRGVELGQPLRARFRSDREATMYDLLVRPRARIESHGSPDRHVFAAGYELVRPEEEGAFARSAARAGARPGPAEPETGTTVKETTCLDAEIAADSVSSADTVPSTAVRIPLPDQPAPDSDSGRKTGRRLRRGHRSIGRALTERQPPRGSPTPATRSLPPGPTIEAEADPVSAVVAPGTPPSMLVRFPDATAFRAWVRISGERARVAVAPEHRYEPGQPFLVVMQLPDSTYVQFDGRVSAHTRTLTEIESGPLEFRAWEPIRAALED